MLSARAAGAQQSGQWDYRVPAASRQQLELVLARYQAAAQSPAYSERLRAMASTAADSIRARLTDGDLRVGDRLRLTVSEQPQLTDTFTVSEGPALVLPVIGSVALAGVLRSELQDRIAARVDSVYHNAVVHVVVLTRLAILGGVGRPGLYSFTSQALVADALTAAGGISPGAQLNDIYVERGRSRLMDADSLQILMRQGKTIGDLRLVDGDRIIVPVSQPTNPLQTLQTFSYLLSLGLSLFTLSRVL